MVKRNRTEKIGAIDNKIRKHLDKVDELRDRKQALLAEELGYKGKFVVADYAGNDYYLRVDELWLSKRTDGACQINLRGFGFNSCFGDYEDDRFVHWSQWIDLEFHPDEAEKRIKVITEKEFNEQFENMMDKLLETHNKILKGE